MTCYCTLQVGCHKEQTAFILWWFEVPVIIRIDLVDQKMNAVCFLVTTYLQSAVAISKETCVCVFVCVCIRISICTCVGMAVKVYS